MAKRVRIVERTSPCGRISYVIQQKHFLFRWWWVDAWINSSAGALCIDYYDTLEEAMEHLCLFDGTRSVDVVVPT